MRENYRNSIASINKFPQFTTMNVIDGQAGLIICASLILCNLTVDNILNIILCNLTVDNILNIIVLLILAGVSISALTGENGILNQVGKGKDKASEADAVERVQIEVLGSYGIDGKIDIDQLNENLKNINGLTYNDSELSDSNKILIMIANYQIVIK